MPVKRTRTAAHRGVGLELDWRPFDAAAVERLVEVVRFPAPPLETGEITLDDVARALNAIAILWRAGRDAADAPTDRMLEDKLASLRTALRRACALAPLHVDDCPWTEEPGHDPRLPPRLTERLRPFVTPELLSKYAHRLSPSPPDADTLLAELVEGLVDLSAIVSAAHAGPGADEAMDAASEPAALDLSTPNQTLVQSLAGVYSALFDRKIVTSTRPDTNKPSGPLLRFLNAALCVLETPIPDYTLIGYLEPIKGARCDARSVFAETGADEHDGGTSSATWG